MAKVLVVDDDSHFRGILERIILRSYTYSVKTAATEEEAWEELSRDPHDLVLLDLYIDGKKSWETLRRIRDLQSVPDVIVVSCEDTNENAEYARSLGALDFIPKPIDFARFKATVDTAGTGDPAATDQAFRAAQKRIDTAVSKGIVHKRTASRRKSRLARRVNTSA